MQVFAFVFVFLCVLLCVFLCGSPCLVVPRNLECHQDTAVVKWPCNVCGSMNVGDGELCAECDSERPETEAAPPPLDVSRAFARAVFSIFFCMEGEAWHLRG